MRSEWCIVNVSSYLNKLCMTSIFSYFIKHCALQVPPAGYDIVGENLIEAIKAVLGLEDSHPIIQTWKKAYQEIADVFIQVEKDIYSKMLWEGFQPFKIEKIDQLSSDIKSFTVVSDKYDLSQFTPGEYITFILKHLILEQMFHNEYVLGLRLFLLILQSLIE